MLGRHAGNDEAERRRLHHVDDQRHAEDEQQAPMRAGQRRVVDRAQVIRGRPVRRGRNRREQAPRGQRHPRRHEEHPGDHHAAHRHAGHVEVHVAGGEIVGKVREHAERSRACARPERDWPMEADAGGVTAGIMTVVGARGAIVKGVGARCVFRSLGAFPAPPFDVAADAPLLILRHRPPAQHRVGRGADVLPRSPASAGSCAGGCRRSVRDTRASGLLSNRYRSGVHAARNCFATPCVSSNTYGKRIPPAPPRRACRRGRLRERPRCRSSSPRRWPGRAPDTRARTQRTLPDVRHERTVSADERDEQRRRLAEVVRRDDAAVEVGSGNDGSRVPSGSIVDGVRTMTPHTFS